jgi:hypothetical protein
MTESTARTIANTLLGAGAIAALWYVARTPPLRRVALGLLRTGVTVTLPAFLLREVQTAWRESEQTPDTIAVMARP